MKNHIFLETSDKKLKERKCFQQMTKNIYFNYSVHVNNHFVSHLQHMSTFWGEKVI